MALIALEGIGKRYDLGEVAIDALRDVSLTIDEGEAVAIMGPSGSGKSTLLAILGCLDPPTIGSYRLGGDEVGKMSAAALAAIRCRRIGFVFQGFNLLPRLTAIENVELPLAYAGLPPRKRREKAAATLERLGLSERMNHLPNQLSGGQQQRVAIARSLVNDPDLILADEPTGALDTRTGNEILEVLEGINAGGTALVVVTHDVSVADRLRRRIALKDGRVGKDSDHPTAAEVIERRAKLALVEQ
ncbi:ABC transporter ATP-binding protein [Devosia nitrariae]|uniref:ABC transporter ATP-binding protein n=1 Tax=Devosia nitrariae TaxID=2071872 RepID=A0ABQ5W5B3_9HYPH|nr:ABC transporter ATP-binding protein [Devosia nitrariae]GLQ55265.1 putative ABC transporter ATP-binding protein [Devosia nitrariae]